jgi:hypothetical protein
VKWEQFGDVFFVTNSCFLATEISKWEHFGDVFFVNFFHFLATEISEMGTFW